MGVVADPDLQRHAGIAETVAHVLDPAARLQELDELEDRSGDELTTGGPRHAHIEGFDLQNRVCSSHEEMQSPPTNATAAPTELPAAAHPTDGSTVNPDGEGIFGNLRRRPRQAFLRAVSQPSSR
jgi:hypothetical protein